MMRYERWVGVCRREVLLVSFVGGALLFFRGQRFFFANLLRSGLGRDRHSVGVEARFSLNDEVSLSRPLRLVVPKERHHGHPVQIELCREGNSLLDSSVVSQ